jgi:hypothetical protein
MNWFHSSKKNSPKQPSAFFLLLVASVVTFFSGLAALQQTQISRPATPTKKGGNKNDKNDKKKISTLKKSVLSAHTNKSGSKKPNPSPSPTLATLPPPASQKYPAFTHLNIISTVFWVGEGATSDNAHISNAASAWDGVWAEHFGGIDDPNHRNGYLPASFTTKENPFYVALPYNDLTENGDRKANAINCPQYAQLKNHPYSWCKNAWLAVRSGDKIAYAQWEDSGPLGEDDTNYVFGNSQPLNIWGAKAGIDLSPAMRDYLGVEDVDRCDWTFISAGEVPDGPWKQIITTTPGYQVN